MILSLSWLFPMKAITIECAVTARLARAVTRRRRAVTTRPTAGLTSLRARRPRRRGRLRPTASRSRTRCAPPLPPHRRRRTAAAACVLRARRCRSASRSRARRRAWRSATTCEVCRCRRAGRVVAVAAGAPPAAAGEPPAAAGASKGLVRAETSSIRRRPPRWIVARGSAASSFAPRCEDTASSSPCELGAVVSGGGRPRRRRRPPRRRGGACLRALIEEALWGASRGRTLAGQSFGAHDALCLVPRDVDAAAAAQLTAPHFPRGRQPQRRADRPRWRTQRRRLDVRLRTRARAATTSRCTPRTPAQRGDVQKK